MSEQQDPIKGKRDRSPSYPSIPLGVAIERVAILDEHFKRHPAPYLKAGLAWEMKPASSQSTLTLAALKSFGLVEYQASGQDLKVVLTEDSRTYLRAQQENIKKEILQRLALKPKAIAKYWSEWGSPRPIDEVCLDELVLKAKFSQVGADTFLKVYDATIAFAGLGKSDTLNNKDDLPPDKGNEIPKVEIGDYIQWSPAGVLQFKEPQRVRATQQHEGSDWVFVDGSDTGIPMSEVSIERKGDKPPANPPILPTETHMVASEREWLRGPLSKDTAYRLIVTGNPGPKEIGKLIKLLEAQKDILTDDEEETT